MECEMNALEVEMDSWEVILRKGWMNILPSTLVFLCKRFPDGTVRKLKASSCICGDKQEEGVDYFNTFAPVVSWQTVRLMLVLTVILGLSTKQLDYTAAFLHVPIDLPPDFDSMTNEQKNKPGLYVEMPRDFNSLGKVLKLKN
jgi:hypothetical protein